MNADHQDPATLGRYRILHLLGEGGMGRVYLGISRGYRLVAVKVIRPEHVRDPGFRDRFRQEVEAAKKVSGLFTAPVLEADPDGTPPWLATAYVPAPNLSEVVRSCGKMDVQALRALGAGLAEALAAVHQAGIVHGDLKPGNVLVAGDGLRVIDFGLARAFEASGSTMTGTMIGTPGYMAPEQLKVGGKLEPATDVFALGCVLTFAATGAGPFGSGDYEEIAQRTDQDDHRLDTVPTSIRQLIASCLNRDTGQRPRIADLRAELTPTDPAHMLTPQLSRELASRAEQASLLLEQVKADAVQPPARQKPGRRSFLIAAGTTGLVLGAGIAGGARILSPRARTHSRSAPSATASTVAMTAKAGPAPTPLWRRAIQQTVDTTTLSSSLVQLGGTLVRWNETSVLGYDASSGTPTWDYATDLSSGSFNAWLGVHGAMLLGLSATADPHLLGLNAAGKIALNAPLASAMSAVGIDPTQATYACLGAARGVTVLVTVEMTSASTVTSGTRASVVAVDSVSGDALWHRRVSWGFWEIDSGTHAGPTKGGVVDVQHCFLQDGSVTLAIDLRTGAVQWTAQNTASTTADVAPQMWSDGNTLLVASSSASLLALDAASGAQLWSTSASALGALGGLAIGSGRVYQMDTQRGVQAFEARSGKMLWNTLNPVSEADSGEPASNLTLSVSSSIVAAPLWGTTSGVVVLSASDGRPLWAYRDPVAAGSTWSVLASAAVYGDSGAALYAFPVGA